MAAYQSFPFKLFGTFTVIGFGFLWTANLERTLKYVLGPFDGMNRDKEILQIARAKNAGSH